MSPALYIFDLDGTLVDSAEDIAAATVQTITEFSARVERTPGGSPPIEMLVRRWIARGGPLHEIFASLAPGIPTEALIARYREIYSENCARTTVPYPGVVETLEKLDGARRAVATTKKSWLARLLLEKLGLVGHFDLIQGTDDFPYKPHPAILHRVLGHFSVSPEGALMVGDTAADILCAQAAGVPCAAALYGIGDPAELRALRPRYLLEEFSELLTKI